MISKRSIMVLKPARKPAVLLAIMAVLPALSLWAYEPPISVVVGLLLASVMGPHQPFGLCGNLA